MIALGEATGQLAFAQEARDAIVAAARGSPYLIGLLAQQAAGRAIDRQGDEVAAADVADAMRAALRDIWVRLSPRTQQQVEAVRARLSPAASAALAAEALSHFGFVMPAEGDERLSQAVGVASDLGLLQPARLGDREGHRFADDSAALHLWLASRSDDETGGAR